MITERLYYSCNQCGGIHEENIRNVACHRTALQAKILSLGVWAMSREELRELKTMSRTDEKARP